MAEHPPPTEQERQVLSWCSEALEEADAFMKVQPGYAKIEETLKAVMGTDPRPRPSKLSNTTANYLGKNADDLIASLTDVKPFWEYRTSNHRFQPSAINYGKLSLHWWLQGGTGQKGADMRFADVLRYAAVGGTGWAHLTYSSRAEDIDLMAEDPRDVLPIRPASYDTVQDAVGVIIRRARTVNYVRGLDVARGKESLIQATRDGSAALEGGRSSSYLDHLWSPFRARLFGESPARQVPRIPTLDLYTLYVHDDSRHESVRPRYMGEWDRDAAGNAIALNNWSYKVEKGQKIYPRGRCITFTDQTILRDGPNVYWHGKFPLPKLTLNPWPTTWLGKAPLWDLLPLQESLTAMLRIVDDHMAKIAEPDVIADVHAMSRSALDRINTRRPGNKYMTNPMAGKGFQIPAPPPLPTEVFRFVEFIIEQMASLSGVRDLSQLMRLNQLPGADTIEKMMESMTASVRMRSRVIESFMREFAMMLAYNFTQFYTLPVRLAVLGPSGMTFEDYDFDPGTMIPDYVHEEDFSEVGTPTMEAMVRGPLPRYDRAHEFLRQFTYHIAPGSLLSASEIERKLLYLQLSRAGLVDHWTLLEILGIPNVGEPPEGASTITARLLKEQEMGLGMNISPTGRKATGQTMPRLVTKES